MGMHETKSVKLGFAWFAITGCAGDPREDGDDGSFSGSASLSMSASADDTGGTEGSGTADDDGVSTDTEGTKLDVGNSSADSSTGIDECAGIEEEGEVTLQPADIIVIVDNSGSMELEANAVQAYLNMFSSQIFLANIDAQVVLISSYPDSGHGICLDPPLGNGGCPVDDNNPPLYTHVNQSVDSTNGLQLLISTHPMWSAAMRPSASKHIIAVTDDNSDLNAADFTNMWTALDPTYVPFKVHAIAAPQDPITSCLDGNASGCCAISAAAGLVYQQLTNQTMGIFGNLCAQEFQPIFDDVAEQVIQGSAIACEFAIPAPPDGMEFDPMQVNVEFEDDVGATLDIGYVESAAECANVTNGWYYDDPTDPTQIILCPQTCETVQGFTMAKLFIEFGCATQPAG
jgi:hypothetical protein